MKTVIIIFFPLLSVAQMIVPIKLKSTPDLTAKFPVSGTQKFIGLFGQSNAVGNADTSTCPIKTPINAYIFDILTVSYKQLQYGLTSRQSLSNLTNNAGYGIELELMSSLSNLYGKTQFILKYAYSGTYLANSGTTNWNISAANNTQVDIFSLPGLYVTGVNFSKVAIQKIPIRNKSLEWIVWIQGENDANGGATIYNAYQTNLTNLINSIRSQTGLGTNLKFCLVSLSSNQTAIDATGRSAVNTAMSNIAGSLTSVFYVSQNGTTKADATHYDSGGITTIANAVYNVIISN